MYLDYMIDNYANEEMLFSYNGKISQTFIFELEDVIKRTLTSHNEDIQNKTVRNIFSIAVEQLQNIIKYSKNSKELDNKKECEGTCLIAYDKSKKKYLIKTLNNIEVAHKDKISDKLDKINKLDDKEKRKYLRELLRSGDGYHKDGAGVGFLEIAKRASEKLQYSFIKSDDEYFFELTIYI